MVDRLFVLEDAASQLRTIESAILCAFTYITVPAEGVFDGVAALFPQGKVLPALIIVDFKEMTQARVRLLQDIRGSRPLIPLVVLLPFGEEAMRKQMFALGASEVLTKPMELDRLTHSIQTVLKMQRMSMLIGQLERRVSGMMGFGDIVGYSAPIKHVISMGEHVAVARKHALIEGESGTGKSLMARAIHGSTDGHAAFVWLDCENLPEDRAEEFVFGEKGKISEAKGGTLYLRELGCFPALLQHQLVEALQKVETGSDAVRVIASSSVPLEPLIRKGLFSHGLYRFVRRGYIPMPRLDDRREDIPLLAQHFLAMHTARDNKFIHRFSEDALRALANSEWPGNVAQLSDLVHRCTMLCNQDTIDAGTLRLVQQLEPVHYAGQMQQLAGDMPSLVDMQGKIKKLKNIEDEAIRFALKHYGGSMTKAAASLGIGRSTLYRRMVEGGKDQMPRANQTTRPMIRMSNTDFS